MEPTDKRVKEANGRGRNTYFITGDCSDFQSKYSNFSNNFLKQTTVEKSFCRKNESTQHALHIGSTLGGMGGGVGRGAGVRVAGAGAGAGAAWKGNAALIGMDERRIRGLYNQNVNIMSNPNCYFNLNLNQNSTPNPIVNPGMVSKTYMPIMHHSNVKMIPSQNRNVLCNAAGIEHKRINGQSVRLHHEGVPIFYEPLKYPPFKMADRLKNEKKDGRETLVEKNEIEEMKKEKECEGNNGVVGMIETQEENKNENQEKIEQKEKATVLSFESQGTVHGGLEEKHVENKVEKTDEQEKEKCKIRTCRKELKCNEEIDAKHEFVDDMCTKQIPCPSGEANTAYNKEDKEIKEFLALSLNPSNITINPATITNEIKFILHMTLLTLYRDQIKPTYRKIKKRLKCFSENFEIKYNFLNIYALLQDQYIVVRSKNNNVFVLLRETPKWFLGWVNTKSFTNSYPKSVWKYFITYLLDISKVKWQYGYSSFLLKFINYLKQSQLLFYVKSKKEDSLSISRNYNSEALNFLDPVEENPGSSEHMEKNVYRCIDENFFFSFFSYLDTFYNNNREKSFCDAFISFLKEEKDSSNAVNYTSEKTNDDDSSQRRKLFSENLKQEKEDGSGKEKERKTEEETKATRICYEKNKNIFNSKENIRGDEKCAKKKNKWEFDNDIYDMANFLKKQSFFFFKNYSLGKIAHIVQLSLYNGLLMEEGGCIKPTCAVKAIVPSVFYFKGLQTEGEEEKKLMEEENEERGEKQETLGFTVDRCNTSIGVQENVLHHKQEQSFLDDNLFYDDSYFDVNFSFGYSDYSKFEKSDSESDSESESESEKKKAKDKKSMHGDVFDQMLSDVQEARNNFGYHDSEVKKRELFHWDYLCSKENDICQRELFCDINEHNLIATNSKNALVSKTNDISRSRQTEKKNNNLVQNKKDEIIGNLQIIKNLEEAKVKIERLLKHSYKRQMYLYVFRERFCKKYKEVINPLYFGYNSLIEFLFYACKEVCKIYIVNKNIVLMHPSCNINYLQNKKENTPQPFSYLDYFYSAPEKKKENEKKEETKLKNEQNTKFENHSLEICTIMKDLAKKRNNFFITFHFWKKWNTKNKNILNEVNFFRLDNNENTDTFQLQNKWKYYNLFNSTRANLFDLSEFSKK